MKGSGKYKEKEREKENEERQRDIGLLAGYHETSKKCLKTIIIC